MKEKTDAFELSIHLDQPDTLRLLYPKEKHEHVSLTLSGKLGDDDIIFLNGDVLKETVIDEDTGETIDFFWNPYWDTIDLTLTDVSILFSAFNKIDPYGIQRLVSSNIQLKSNEVYYLYSEEGLHPQLLASVTSLLVTKEVKRIQTYNFNDFKNLHEYYAEENSDFVVIDGVLFTKDKSILVSMPPASQYEDYEIPEGTVSVANNAFCGCRNLKSLFIPKSVVKIANNSFEGCDNLEKFVVDPLNKYYYTKKDVLYEHIYSNRYHSHDFAEDINCLFRFPPAKALKNGKVNLRYDNYTEMIADYAFSGCKNIKELYIHVLFTDNIDYLFYNIPNLTVLSVSCNKYPDIRGCDNLEILEIFGAQYVEHYLSYINIKSIKEYRGKSNVFHTTDGVVFNNQNELCLYPPKKEDKVYVVPEGTTAIVDNVFYNAFFLEEIIVPPDINIKTLAGELTSYKDYDKKEELFTTYDDKIIKVTIVGASDN
jgi:hypothetical protein